MEATLAITHRVAARRQTAASFSEVTLAFRPQPLKKLLILMILILIVILSFFQNQPAQPVRRSLLHPLTPLSSGSFSVPAFRFDLAHRKP